MSGKQQTGVEPVLQLAKAAQERLREGLERAGWHVIDRLQWERLSAAARDRLHEMPGVLRINLQSRSLDVPFGRSVGLSTGWVVLSPEAGESVGSARSPSVQDDE